jgi:hypothetical protein
MLIGIKNLYTNLKENMGRGKKPTRKKEIAKDKDEKREE